MSMRKTAYLGVAARTQREAERAKDVLVRILLEFLELVLRDHLHLRRTERALQLLQLRVLLHHFLPQRIQIRRLIGSA